MARRRYGHIKTRKLKDGTNSYLASYTIPYSRRRKTRTFRNRTQASQWLKEKELQSLNGTLYEKLEEEQAQKEAMKAAAITIADHATDWIARLEKYDASPNTIRSYVSNLNCHILPKLGSTPLKQLSKSRCRSWWHNLDHDKPEACKNAYRVLSALLHDAVIQEIIPVSPLKIPGAMKTGRKIRTEAQERVATPEQLDLISQYMPSDLRISVYLAGLAGLRYSEIAALTRRHVDLVENVIKVRAAVKRTREGKTVLGPPKSERAVRDVPIGGLLRSRLVEHLAEHVEDSPDALVVFSACSKRVFLTNSSLHSRFNPACVKAGLAGFGFHQLRATCATRLMRAGATPVEVQTILGHADWATSRLYQRAPKGRLVELMGKL